MHGQTSANRTKPGPSFQLLKWLFGYHAFMVLLSTMEQHTLKKCKQVLEFQNLHLLKDIW